MQKVLINKMPTLPTLSLQSIVDVNNKAMEDLLRNKEGVGVGVVVDVGGINDMVSDDNYASDEEDSNTHMTRGVGGVQATPAAGEGRAQEATINAMVLDLVKGMTTFLIAADEQLLENIKNKSCNDTKSSSSSSSSSYNFNNDTNNSINTSGTYNEEEDEEFIATHVKKCWNVILKTTAMAMATTATLLDKIRHVLLNDTLPKLHTMYCRQCILNAISDTIMLDCGHYYEENDCDGGCDDKEQVLLEEEEYLSNDVVLERTSGDYTDMDYNSSSKNSSNSNSDILPSPYKQVITSLYDNAIAIILQLKSQGNGDRHHSQQQQRQSSKIILTTAAMTIIPMIQTMLNILPIRNFTTQRRIVFHIILNDLLVALLTKNDTNNDFDFDFDFNRLLQLKLLPCIIQIVLRHVTTIAEAIFILTWIGRQATIHTLFFNCFDNHCANDCSSVSGSSSNNDPTNDNKITTAATATARLLNIIINAIKSHRFNGRLVIARGALRILLLSLLPQNLVNVGNMTTSSVTTTATTTNSSDNNHLNFTIWEAILMLTLYSMNDNDFALINITNFLPDTTLATTTTTMKEYIEFILIEMLKKNMIYSSSSCQGNKATEEVEQEEESGPTSSLILEDSIIRSFQKLVRVIVIMENNDKSSDHNDVNYYLDTNEHHGRMENPSYKESIANDCCFAVDGIMKDFNYYQNYDHKMAFSFVQLCLFLLLQAPILLLQSNNEGNSHFISSASTATSPTFCFMSRFIQHMFHTVVLPLFTNSTLYIRDALIQSLLTSAATNLTKLTMDNGRASATTSAVNAKHEKIGKTTLMHQSTTSSVWQWTLSSIWPISASSQVSGGDIVDNEENDHGGDNCKLLEIELQKVLLRSAEICRRENKDGKKARLQNVDRCSSSPSSSSQCKWLKEHPVKSRFLAFQSILLSWDILHIIAQHFPHFISVQLGHQLLRDWGSHGDNNLFMKLLDGQSLPITMQICIVERIYDVIAASTLGQSALDNYSGKGSNRARFCYEVNVNNLQQQEGFDGARGNNGLYVHQVLHAIQRLMLNFNDNDVKDDFGEVSTNSQLNSQAIGIILSCSLLSWCQSLDEADVRCIIGWICRILKCPVLSGGRNIIVWIYGCNLLRYHGTWGRKIGLQQQETGYLLGRRTSSCANQSLVGDGKIFFEAVKEIMAWSRIIQLENKLSWTHLDRRGAVLGYRNVSRRRGSGDAIGRPMVFCIVDFLHLRAQCENSVDFLPSSEDIDLELSYCSRGTLLSSVFHLFDAYIELGRIFSQNGWAPHPWLRASLQLPKWPHHLIPCKPGGYNEYIDTQQPEELELVGGWELGYCELEVSNTSAIPYNDDCGAAETSIHEIVELGWACVLGASTCCAVLKHSYASLVLDENKNATSRSLRDSRNSEAVMIESASLVKNQLSRFYDLMIRAQMCAKVLSALAESIQLHIATSGKQVLANSSGERPCTNVTEKEPVARATRSAQSLLKTVTHQRKYMINPSCVCFVLTNAEDFILINNFLAGEHNQRDLTNIRIAIHLRICALEHLSELVLRMSNSFAFDLLRVDSKSRRIKSSKNTCEPSFHCPVDLASSTIFEKKFLMHLSKAIALLSPFLIHLRKFSGTDYHEHCAGTVPFSICTRLIAAHYQVIVSALSLVRRTNGRGKSEAASKHHLKKCLLEGLLCGITADTTVTKSNSEMQEALFSFFSKQLQKCEDASLAVQIVDIVSLVALDCNKAREVGPLIWTSFRTVFPINPDLFGVKDALRSQWRLRISSPPHAFAAAVEKHISSTPVNDVALSALQCLLRICSSKSSRLEQCCVLRHFLLSFWSMNQPIYVIHALEDTLCHLRYVLEKKLASKGSKRKEEVAFPLISQYFAPECLELVFGMGIATLSLLVPGNEEESLSSEEHEGPFASIQDGVNLVCECIEVFTFKRQSTSDQSLTFMVKNCFVVLKAMFLQLKQCVAWRNRQPVLTLDEVAKGGTDFAAIIFLKKYIDTCALCVGAIDEFCNVVRSFDVADRFSGTGVSASPPSRALSIKCESAFKMLCSVSARHNLAAPSLSSNQRIMRKKNVNQICGSRPLLSQKPCTMEPESEGDTLVEVQSQTGKICNGGPKKRRRIAPTLIGDISGHASAGASACTSNLRDDNENQLIPYSDHGFDDYVENEDLINYITTEQQDTGGSLSSDEDNHDSVDSVVKRRENSYLGDSHSDGEDSSDFGALGDWGEE